MCENKAAPAAPKDGLHQKLIVPPERRQRLVIFVELLKLPFIPLNTCQPEFQGAHEVPEGRVLAGPGSSQAPYFLHLAGSHRALRLGRFPLWRCLGRVMLQSCEWESLPTPSPQCRVEEGAAVEMSSPWRELVWVGTGLGGNWPLASVPCPASSSPHHPLLAL